MLNLDNTINPHRGQKILYESSGGMTPDSAMILLHGRGADAASMRILVNELETEGMLYVIPEASNFSWYPYRFIEKREVNEPHISSGLILINSIVKALRQKDIQTKNIFILGFSQGACLGADYVARYPDRFAGVFVLSGGLIGDVINKSDYNADLQQTPVFFGCSDKDFHIPEQRVNESARIFQFLNADVTRKIYPDMDHTINRDELNFIKLSLSKQTKVNKKVI